jgi:hypothetical protein
MSKLRIAQIAESCSKRSRRAHRTRRAGTFLLTLSLLLIAYSVAFAGENRPIPFVDDRDYSSLSQPLTLSGNMPAASVGHAYNTAIAVSGGQNPYQFSVRLGSLPPGVTLNTSTGALTGTPIASGSYIFEVVASDLPRLDHGMRIFSISVAASNPGSPVHVTVSPSGMTLAANQTQTFTAAVTGTNNTAVNWSASAGSITSGGKYTAPVVNATTNVSITATSAADPSQRALASVTVTGPSTQPVSITTASLPDAQLGNSYSASLSASGGRTPYTWSVSAGMPQGISLSSSSGAFTGVPANAGTFNFTATVTDAGGVKAQKSFLLSVTSGGNFDGPAELPRTTMPSAISDTPAPGKVVSVPAGGNLQLALNNAQCGDTISLQAGATFTGSFNFPAKSCDDNHWIIVRTSAPDSALPAEGQRATPCNAGVASLPGRPQYACSNPQNVMAKLVFTTSGVGPIQFDSGANHYRLIGLELTRPAGTKPSPTLMAVVTGGTADHIVVDRSWLHGTAQDETRLGFQLAGTTNVAVVDSYFSDFHCTSRSGTCTDAHAIGGGNGNNPGGIYKIEDNFLEASGEAVMFGGGNATTTPTDIEIRRNHFYKPMQWMKGEPNFVGGPAGDPFIVKNHLELKNAVRVLVEANLMEDSWGGFSQVGYGILLSPKNQHTQSGDNVCPVCQVTDVTIRYTKISHAGAGIQLATAMSGDGKNGAPALAGTRWSIHDVVMDDISRKYVGGGSLFEVQNGWPANPLNTVTINHITGFPDPTSHIIIMGDVYPNPMMHGFVFTNNVVITGAYPIWNSGGGPNSCAYSNVPVKSLSTCFTSYTFANNALIAPPSSAPPSAWPTGNYFPQTAVNQFVRYNDGVGGNYELDPSSPYKNKGTDGRDLGADIAGLEAALAGVE